MKERRMGDGRLLFYLISFDLNEGACVCFSNLFGFDSWRDSKNFVNYVLILDVNVCMYLDLDLFKI